MLGSKVSQFLKKRYLVTPDGADYVLAREAVQVEQPIVPAAASTSASASASASALSEAVPEQEVIAEQVEPEVELDNAQLDYEKSNQGRTYGWWVCIDGQRVATLEYRCLLEDPVHLYSVNVLDDKFLRIDLDPERWLDHNVTFQSRYAGNYIRQGLSMAAVGNKMIVVEELFIPEDHFLRQHRELEVFHDKLINKAKNRSKA